MRTMMTFTMPSIAWIAVLWTAQWLNYSHAFVSPSPFVMKRAQAPLWKATNKDAANSKPSAIVIPASPGMEGTYPKNSTATTPLEKTSVKESSIDDAGKEKVVSATNAPALQSSKTDDSPANAPQQNTDGSDSPFEPTLTPLGKDGQALEKETLDVEQSDIHTGGSTESKEEQSKKSQSRQAGMTVATKKVPTPPQTAPIFNRMNVPPLEKVSVDQEVTPRESPALKDLNEITDKAKKGASDPSKEESSSVTANKSDASVLAAKNGTLSATSSSMPKTTLSTTKDTSKTSGKVDPLAAKPSTEDVSKADVNVEAPRADNNKTSGSNKASKKKDVIAKILKASPAVKSEPGASTLKTGDGDNAKDLATSSGGVMVQNVKTSEETRLTLDKMVDTPEPLNETTAPVIAKNVDTPAAVAKSEKHNVKENTQKPQEKASSFVDAERSDVVQSPPPSVVKKGSVTDPLTNQTAKDATKPVQAEPPMMSKTIDATPSTSREDAFAGVQETLYAAPKKIKASAKLSTVTYDDVPAKPLDTYAASDTSSREAIADFFFGSSVELGQDDVAVMKRIRERKQEGGEERDKVLALTEQLEAAQIALDKLQKESNDAIAKIRAETRERESELKSQVNEMTVRAEVSESLSNRLQQKMQEMTAKQLELDSEAQEWQERYARDSPLWTAKYEREREYRQQEQIAARERLSQAMTEARDQLKLVHEESRKRESTIREELTKILEQNKRTLSYTTIELKQAKTALAAKDAKIEELGGERDSLRQLAKEAWALIKQRTKNRWNKLTNRVGRGRKTQRVE